MAHTDTKFKPFELTLASSSKLAGIAYVPTESQAAGTFRPLIVLVHGGGCHSGYYDVDTAHSSSSVADSFCVLIVSIDRPCYRNTSSLFPIPEGSSFHQETGRWHDEYIFPALWETYGLPNHCTALVAMGHSLAVPGLLVAAALHAESPHPKYPLASLILSGWGTRPHAAAIEARLAWTAEERQENRGLLMLSAPSLQAADVGMEACLAAQSVDPPPEEARECVGEKSTWSARFPGIAQRITVPVMHGLGEHDWLWQGTRDHVEEFAGFFVSSPRVDSSVVRGAPHAIEWSHYAQGWYARCFGFALETTAHLGIMSGKTMHD